MLREGRLRGMSKQDVMELLYKIQEDCNCARLCKDCNWYSGAAGECMFFEDPSEWNVPEITERSVEE